MMNERIKELALQADAIILGSVQSKSAGLLIEKWEQKFAELIIQECYNAVLSVPCYYKDYRSQIEQCVIHDCANSIKQHFEIQQ
jgi:hypothetical protein